MPPQVATHRPTTPPESAAYDLHGQVTPAKGSLRKGACVPRKSPQKSHVIRPKAKLLVSGPGRYVRGALTTKWR
jgi:hypothetical protein